MVELIRQAHSYNQCCSGKAISITYCGCVFVALGIQHAMHMRRIIIDGQSGSTTFFHIISQKARLSEEKKILNTKCVFWFSLQLLSQTFLILRTERDMIEMCIGLHVKYPLFLSDFNETRIFSTDFRKIFKHQISKSVRWEPSCSTRTNRWTDRLTGTHDRLIVAFAILRTCQKKRNGRRMLRRKAYTRNKPEKQ